MARSHSLPLVAVVIVTGCLLAATSGCGEHLGLVELLDERRGLYAGQIRRPRRRNASRSSASTATRSTVPAAKPISWPNGWKGRCGPTSPILKSCVPSEIADWIDNQDQDLTDYREVGRGVKADMVVGIDLHQLQHSRRPDAAEGPLEGGRQGLST